MKTESKLVSSTTPPLEVVVVAALLDFRTKTDSGGRGPGCGRAVVDDFENTAFESRLLPLLLLLVLNLKPDFAEDEDDDCFEDPESSPFGFPVPAFNGEVLMGCWFFTLFLLLDFLLLIVLLPPN